VVLVCTSIAYKEHSKWHQLTQYVFSATLRRTLAERSKAREKRKKSWLSHLLTESDKGNRKVYYTKIGALRLRTNRPAFSEEDPL
jgi:hypothetical protein